MKFQIKNRFSGAVQYECELPEEIETLGYGLQLGFATKKAIEEGADLTGANLTGANLTWANLRGANLREANLIEADLRAIREDFYTILSTSIAEIPSLEAAMLAGKIDGSTYSGECACLCGTIEKARGVEKSNMRDCGRPIERWFLAIEPGHTPDNNPIAKITYDWLQEFKQTIGG